MFPSWCQIMYHSFPSRRIHRKLQTRSACKVVCVRPARLSGTRRPALPEPYVGDLHRAITLLTLLTRPEHAKQALQFPAHAGNAACPEGSRKLIGPSFAEIIFKSSCLPRHISCISGAWVALVGGSCIETHSMSHASNPPILSNQATELLQELGGLPVQISRRSRSRSLPKTRI